MKEENKLFVDSVNMHQKLVDIIVEAKDDDGISRISQPEMAELTNRSQSWVGKAIRRLNTEDICIEMVASGQYVVHYANILEKGVFCEVLKLINDYYVTPELLNTQDKILAAERGIKTRTSYMFKSYIRLENKSLSFHRSYF